MGLIKNPRLTGNRGFSGNSLNAYLGHTLHIACWLYAETPNRQTSLGAMRARTVFDYKHLVHFNRGLGNAIAREKSKGFSSISAAAVPFFYL